MADLDDFFAKKDRKKSKTSTKKFTTTATAEELAKKVEEPVAVKKPEPVKKLPPAEGATDEEADVVPEVGPHILISLTLHLKFHSNWLWLSFCCHGQREHCYSTVALWNECNLWLCLLRFDHHWPGYL